ncbi:MAG: endonuclease/exonuclease/phosphatase family protein [Candidatus Sumerlaeaceae bacterium]|nr:endonuclease/exonuclease/phosphatase family protein [Candidatus Sumerlaeaceae bacterium]
MPVRFLKKALTSRRRREEVPDHAPTPELRGPMVRLLTYNIHHGRGLDRRYDLERIARVIEHERPDIVALQEVEKHRKRTRADNQPAWLAKRLGMHHVFARIVDHRYEEKHPDAYYGVAVLSRFPITAHHHFNLSYRAGIEPRGCLHAAVEVEGTPLHVFCVHLGLRLRERDYQMARLLSDDIVGHERFGQGPRVLLGDFNNWWPVASARLISQHFRNACLVTGRKRLRTYGSYFSLLCLDYVFTSADLRVVSCEVVSTRLARIASDHRPLSCTVEMPPRGNSA